MVKKLKEYKPGDFIFAKVKGYPAWPARVKGVNGKKYFVYFYGTGETANLASNVLFDYLENKERFLVKPIKRKDFNDGVAQINYDITNKVPLDNSDFVPAAESSTNDVSLNETADATADSTIDESVADTTAEDATVDTPAVATQSETAVTTQSEMAVEDSDDGQLVIDEAKVKTKPKKGRPSNATKAATPKAAVATPKASVATPKAAVATPKAAGTTPKPTTPKTAKAEKAEKAASKEPPAPKPEKEPKEPKSRKSKEAPAPEEEKVEEMVSRSGRKIKPKRFTDAVVDDSELPITPPAKKRRAATPQPEKPKEKEEKPEEEPVKTFKLNFINQTVLEDIKQPFGDEEQLQSLIQYS